MRQMVSLSLLTSCLLTIWKVAPVAAFQSTLRSSSPSQHRQPHYLASEVSGRYTPPEEASSNNNKSIKKSLHPKVGDLVRFYDIDGGRDDGQVLIGRISFVSSLQASDNNRPEWTVELVPMDNVGDGYYADFPGRLRRRMTTTRNLKQVSPVMASFVRSEAAYKVPTTREGDVVVRAETYDLNDYLGPFTGTDSVNAQVVMEDGELYEALKSKLLKYTALTGLAGTVVAELTKGLEDASIYFAGVVASLLYLFFLTIKTDTLASEQAKLGKNVSNLRFLLPTLLLVGVAFYNKSLGDSNPLLGQGTFDTVTAEQFGAAILGFLTYRIPLFLTQLFEAMKEDESGDSISLPGSAGVALQLAKSAASNTTSLLSSDEAALTTVLLVSGPQATGRAELVERLIEEGGGKYVRPRKIDRFQEGTKFEQLEAKNGILSTDKTGRYGLSKEGLFEGSPSSDSVVVVDADVELAKKLTSVGGLRLVSVWVGLGSVAEFEGRLNALIDSGDITIEKEESRESVIRARVREIVQEIEYGISSGIFEFTILNQDENESLRELKEAAAYCFK